MCVQLSWERERDVGRRARPVDHRLDREDVPGLHHPDSLVLGLRSSQRLFLSARTRPRSAQYEHSKRQGNGRCLQEFAGVCCRQGGRALLRRPLRLLRSAGCSGWCGRARPRCHGRSSSGRLRTCPACTPATPSTHAVSAAASPSTGNLSKHPPENPPKSRPLKCNTIQHCSSTAGQDGGCRSVED